MGRPCTHSDLSPCASRTPCQELALKDLSESLPTSVTRPTFHVLEQLDDVELELLPPPPQANPTMTATTSAAMRPKPFITVSPVGLACHVLARASASVDNLSGRLVNSLSEPPARAGRDDRQEPGQRDRAEDAECGLHVGGVAAQEEQAAQALRREPERRPGPEQVPVDGIEHL